MLDVKNAAKSAQKYFNSLNRGKVFNLQLEEVEYSKDKIYIYITLSFSESPFSGISLLGRKYKIFKIKVSTGKVESMKIREL